MSVSVLFLILVGSSSVYNRNQHIEKVLLDNQIEAYSRHIQHNIKQQFALINENLFALRQLYNSSKNITYEQFQQFSQPIFHRIKGLQAIEWAPRVERSDRLEFVDSMRSLGFSNFEITRRNQDNLLITSENLSEYYPVQFIAPLQGNESALGFDLGSDGFRAKALRQSVSSGQQAMSQPIQLIQDSDKQPATLIFVPVYTSKHLTLPSNYETIKHQVSGAMLAVIRYSDILNAALAKTIENNFSLTLHDANQHQKTPIFNSGEHVVNHSLRFEFTVNQRTWLLTLSPTQEYLAAQSLWRKNFTLLAVLIAAMLLGIIILTLSGSHSEVSEIVKKQTEELDKARLKAEAANRVKSNFLAKVSHEIRTPLNAIIGFSHRIEKRELQYLSDQGKEALKAVIRNSDHLLNVVNNLLDISKIETGQVSLNTSSFSLTKLIHDLGEDFAQRAKMKRLNWTYQVTPETDEDIVIRSDRQRLEQILFHLLNNAFDNTIKGHVELSAHYKPELKHLTLCVADTGCGIAKEHMASLFELYSEAASDTPLADAPKHGIGLAMVKAYIDLVGGDLNVESSPGLGTRIEIYIPNVLH